MNMFILNEFVFAFGCVLGAWTVRVACLLCHKCAHAQCVDAYVCVLVLLSLRKAISSERKDTCCLSLSTCFYGTNLRFRFRLASGQGINAAGSRSSQV